MGTCRTRFVAVVFLETVVAFALAACGGGSTASHTTTSGATTPKNPSFAPSPAAPLITSFTPTAGTVGTAVAITGSGFTGATGVWFTIHYGPSAPFGVVSDTQINMIVPADEGTGILGVETPGGMAWSSTQFGVQSTFSSLSPTSGPPGTLVTIDGTGFLSVVGVYFTASSQATTNTQTLQAPWNCAGCSHVENQIKIGVPSGVATGKIRLEYWEGGSQPPVHKSVYTSTFTVTPTLSSFSPTSGGAGTQVTINGTGLTAALSVKFKSAQNPTGQQNLSATILEKAADHLKVAVPSGAGTGKIRVTYQSQSQSVYTSSAFTVLAPQISGVNPLHAPVGTTITIYGNNLTDATQVAFVGGVTATFHAVSSTQITFVVPAAAKTGSISVSGPDVTSNAIGFGVEPRVTGFSPTSAAAGSVLTITGTGLAGATTVAFNGGNGTILSTTATTVRVRVPSGVMNGQITVTTLGNYTSVAPGSFAVKATPT